MNKNGGNNRTRFLLVILLIVVLGVLVLAAFSNPGVRHKIELMSYTRIATPDDLNAIKNNPDGKYILANDIDMSGQEWVPFSFNGVLEGDGHSISNLKITETGDSKRNTYDGNMKEYQTEFAGLFDVMEGAKISDVAFDNVDIYITSDMPCFAGIVAGYMEDSEITGCSVNGTVTLYAHDRMFGVGGVIGYGAGNVTDVTADVTLVCVDTDKETKDEQFMGGICAAGYPNILNCKVIIDGYDSDHGYVHNGGLLGMYQFFPEGVNRAGYMSGNEVVGMITFFEDNEDRRAYCDPYIGEQMYEIPDFTDNTEDFISNEVFEYDVDLLP